MGGIDQRGRLQGEGKRRSAVQSSYEPSAHSYTEGVDVEKRDILVTKVSHLGNHILNQSDPLRLQRDDDTQDETILLPNAAETSAHDRR